jgi:GntR family transcriptional regulator
MVDEEPLMIETSYLSQAMFPSLIEADVETESLYHILAQQYDMVVTEAEHTMEPTMPDAFEAHHLGVEITMPTMLVRVRAFSRDRVPIEMSKAIVRGDRCRFFFRVNTSTPIMQ